MPSPLFFTGRKSDAPHLRTWAEFRKQIKAGDFGDLWDELVKEADRETDSPALTPSTDFPGRAFHQAAVANRDYTVTAAATQRVLRNAMLFKVTGKQAYKRCALRQIYSLIDPSIWVIWRDQNPVEPPIPADLRTGWISRDLGIAYNWLRSSLKPAERQRIVDGIDLLGIQPFLESLPLNPRWMNDPSNWVTCIVGGMGVCGMALGEDHPKAREIVEISQPPMDAYFQIIGPEGEFNESPGYAGSLYMPTIYYSAMQSYDSGQTDRLAAWPFPQCARWIQYLALGPNRIAVFGDGYPEVVPLMQHYAAVAAATRDPVIQGLAKHYRAAIVGSVSKCPDVFELIWLDPTLPAQTPGEDYPKFATFKKYAAVFSSRSDWNPRGSACVVYGKAGREPWHSHHDTGQVCIDAFGERMIRDHGLPAGGYPKNFHLLRHGHNLLTLNEREHPHRAFKGRYLSEGELPDGLGVHWVYDLSACHPDATKVTRAVFHFLPHIVIVIDDATAKSRAGFKLRWHTAKPCKITDDGSFKYAIGKARMSAHVQTHSRGKTSYDHGRHEYRPPYDCNRDGGKLDQPREPYVDIHTQGKHCRLLTAFATGPSSSRHVSWREKNGTLSFEDKKRGRISVRLSRHMLHYKTPSGTGSFNLSMMNR